MNVYIQVNLQALSSWRQNMWRMEEGRFLKDLGKNRLRDGNENVRQIAPKECPLSVYRAARIFGHLFRVQGAAL